MVKVSCTCTAFNPQPYLPTHPPINFSPLSASFLPAQAALRSSATRRELEEMRELIALSRC